MKKRMDKLRVLFLWLPLLLSPCSCKKDLYLMGMLPMSGELWPGGGACLPPMEIALQQINERDDILPDYKLNLIWKDTAVNMAFYSIPLLLARTLISHFSYF